MIWEELCEKAKELGAGIGESGTIYFSHLEFYEDGSIYLNKLDEDTLIASDRTPDQMYQIMKALQ